MFRGTVNPYDEPVAKTTDENLTGENWELILNLCDKVSEEGQNGARNVIAALQKRLTHRNPNVQVYSLSLVEALSKNCGLEVNREIASRAFTQTLERLVTDRTTHDKVKKRTLALIQQWAGEFESDPTLGIMEECYENLKSKNFKFDNVVEEPPREVDDTLRRQEEEELQRVLELSMQDKGGRQQWGQYGGNGYTPSGGAGSSSSRNQSTTNLSNPGPASATIGSSSKPAPTKVPEASAPAPSYTPSAGHSAAPKTRPTAQPASATPTTTALPSSGPASPSSTSPKLTTQPLISRVRALHTFEPTELGELPFEKGDIIKVVDRSFKDWWRGQLKGKTGIFPVNYVEPLPDPTPADMAKEAQMEADVFSQAASIDQLLSMLRGLDPAKDNLADNDELQELYRQSMSLRPKIVKLIDKYTQKRIELTGMNENFKTARQMFETMMEESMAKHNPGVDYDYRQARPYDYGQQTQSVYGWNSVPPQPQPPYGPGYPPQVPQQPYGAAPTPPEQNYVQPYGPPPPVDPRSAYAQQQGYPSYGPQQPQQPAVYQPPQQGQDVQQQLPPQALPQQQQAQAPVQPQQTTPSYQQYPQYAQQAAQQQLPPQQQGPPPQQGPPQQQQQQQQGAPAASQQPQPQQALPGQPFHAQPQQSQALPAQQPQAEQMPAYGVAQPNAQPNVQAPQRQSSVGYTSPPQAQPGPVRRASSEYAPQVQQQPAVAQSQLPQQPAPEQTQYGAAPQPAEQQPQSQQTQPQPQAQGQSAAQGGPPYVWSPNGQYPDPGAQAWAQYYAMGGTDPAGRVYFTPESLPPEGYVPPGAGQPSSADGAGPTVNVTSATPV